MTLSDLLDATYYYLIRNADERQRDDIDTQLWRGVLNEESFEQPQDNAIAALLGVNARLS